MQSDTDKIQTVIQSEEVHRDRLNAEPDFWGSEEEINMANFAYQQICELVGKDIEGTEWDHLTGKETHTEICDKNIYLLQALLKSKNNSNTPDNTRKE